jgi:hypothetical protein
MYILALYTLNEDWGFPYFLNSLVSKFLLLYCVITIFAEVYERRSMVINGGLS